ncbi:MAG: 2-hydroxyglutaryl-CoA dehydratase [Nitrospirae bacterium]|nr:2-hydroxyglutaryl-CoA dehydratase [Nitrospirota bacterium]
MEVFLGIDVGSVTTKVVLIDHEGAVLWSSYKKTQGQPIRALQSAFAALRRDMGDVEIKGVGTTGSGRKLADHIAGADQVKNEITAHAVSAIHFIPNVRTIVEIGGQDSKLILIRNRVVTDFSMNTVCAAGTGSFLEHQAARLGIGIGELGGLALSASSPARIAGRCTVFAESDMIHKQQMGHNLEDIVAGLCDALVRNYLNNLARGKEIIGPVIFQGGVAANPGIKAAFERELGLEFIVPERYPVMGAIGAALLARNTGKTRFKGWSVAEQELSTSSFYCSDCPNSCGVIEINDSDRVIARWGDSCGKWGKLEE